MRVSQKEISLFLMIAFFLHGILYFVFPIEINDSNSWVKFIKYFLIIIFAIVNINVVRTKEVFYSLAFANLAFIFYFFNETTGINHIYLLFVLPILLMFLYRDAFIDYSLIFKVAIYSYLGISVFAYLEFFVFKGLFPRFGVGNFGYRCSSILVNPNNFGITVALLSVFIHSNLSKHLYKLIIIINTLLLIYFSMSKTAAVIFLLYMFYVYARWVPLFVFILFLYLILFFDSSSIEAKYSASLVVRESLVANFLVLAQENLLLPFVDSYEYTDNIYLQLWGFFGLLFLLMFICFNVFIFYKLVHLGQYVKVIALVMFLLAGYTTNYLYLWPLAYMYWGFVFCNSRYLRISYQ